MFFSWSSMCASDHSGGMGDMRKCSWLCWVVHGLGARLISEENHLGDSRPGAVAGTGAVTALEFGRNPVNGCESIGQRSRMPSDVSVPNNENLSMDGDRVRTCRDLKYS